MAFGDVLSWVDDSRRRLVFYNAKNRAHCERVVEYVGVHDVEIEYVEDNAEPNSTVCVQDGDTRLASDDIEAVAAYIDSWETDLSLDAQPPSIFEALDETVFRSTNTRQLVLASWIIELRAAQAGDGRLAVGFRHLSLDRPQLLLYRSLPSTISVSLYGDPDQLPPVDSDLTIYALESQHQTDYWWVVFDGTDTPGQHAALLAEQTADGSYTGFWTYRSSLVKEIREIVDGLDATKLTDR